MGLFDFSIRDQKRVDRDSFGVDDLNDIYGQGAGLDYFDYLNNTTPSHDRSTIYEDVDFIDTFDEVVSKYLTDLAQDATQYSTLTSSSVWVSSNDEEVQTELNNLLEKLEIGEKSTYITRGMIKYGDKFVRLIIDPVKGVVGLRDNYHPKLVCRLEDSGILAGFHIQQDMAPLERYEMVHWMTPFEPVNDDLLETRADILQKYILDKNPLYGFSDLFKVIGTSKRLKYVEDALILGRLARSRMYRMHYVEVGGSGIKERINIMKRYVKNFNRNKSQDFTNKDAFSERNRFSYEEDRYFPTSSGRGESRVDHFGGEMDINGIVDLEYLVKKRNFILGLPADTDQMTNKLQEDAKYARKVSNYQRSFIKGIYQVCDVHLDILNLYKEKRNYTVHVVDVDAFVQTERNDMLTASADFIDRVLQLIGPEESSSLGLNRSYLMKYLFENYLKFPGIDTELLFNKTAATPEEIDKFNHLKSTDEPSVERISKLIKEDSFSKDQLTKLRKVLEEKSVTNSEKTETYVKSNSNSIREKGNEK